MKWLVALALAVLVGTITATSVAGLLTGPPNPTGGGTVPVITTRAPEVAAGSATSAANQSERTTAGAEPADTGGVPTTPTTVGTTALPTTFAELTAHDSSDDCWLAIDGNAYDVTTYLQLHPAGSRTITPWCGLEATVAFATEDGRGEHSEEAHALLETYLIGPLTG